MTLRNKQCYKIGKICPYLFRLLRVFVEFSMIFYEYGNIQFFQIIVFSKIIMGSQNSMLLASEPLPDQYKQVKQSPSIYHNQVDGTHLQKHFVNLHNVQQIQYEKEIFIFRKMNQDKIVSAHYFQNLKPFQLCGSGYRLSYFTHLPLLQLTNNRKISPKQGINLIIQALEGFHILYKKFGGFEVNEGQFYLYQKNTIKIWISSDPSQSRPIQSCEPQKVVEQYMISQIFKIFDHLAHSKLSSCQYTKHLRRFQSQSRKLVSFQRIIEFMRQFQKQENFSNPRKCAQRSSYQDNASPIQKLKVNLKKTEPHSSIKTIYSNQKNLYHPNIGKKQVIHPNHLPIQREGYLQSKQRSNAIFEPFIQKKDPRILHQKKMIRRSADDCYTVQTDAFKEQYENIRFNKVNKAPKHESKKLIQMSRHNRVGSRQLGDHKYIRKNQLMSGVATVKSIFQGSEIQIDSDILVDVQNLDYENRGKVRP